MGSSVQLCSSVGDDISGRAALSQLEAEGLRTDGVQVLRQHRTAQYVAVNTAQKDLFVGMADMGILETTGEIPNAWPSTSLSKPKCLIVDANWSPSALLAWLHYGRSVGALTVLEPVSTAKATRFWETTPPRAFPGHLVDIVTPNEHELRQLHKKATRREFLDSPEWWRVIDALGIGSSGLRAPLVEATGSELVEHGIPQQAIGLLPYFPTVLTKLGPAGVLVTKLLRAGDAALDSAAAAPHVLARCTNGDGAVGGLYVRLFPPEKVLPPGEVVSVNGAGDSLVGALAARLVCGAPMEEAVVVAQRAARLSLQSRDAVCADLKSLQAA